MARCTRTTNLEVHHKRKDGGNDLSNAEVLCQKCHEATDTFGKQGESPPDFIDVIRLAAIKIVWDQCECTRTGGCH